MKPHQRLTLARVALSFSLALGVNSAVGKEADKGADKDADSNSVESQLKFRAGDETGNEIKALKTEVLVMRSEKRALEQLNMLLKKYRGTAMEPEMLLRLGELYMRRARTERFFEIHRTSEQVVTFAPQLVKNASEKAEIRRAVGVYESILEKFPRFRSTDLVIFNDAYARQALGEDKEAERLYGRIVREHPDSNLVPDAYLAMGEINFNRRSFSDALANFRAIRKYPEARVYPYGLYKAAWSYYNLQDAASGVTQLEEVVKYGHEMAKLNLDPKLDLRKEALADLALFYSDVFPSSKAIDYFKKQAGELDAAPYILRLVELYKRHSKYPDVATVLNDFLSKMPKSESTALAYDELIWNSESMKDRPSAVAQMAKFDKYCDGEKEGAKSAAADQVKLWQACHTKLSETTKKLATKWHAQWRQATGGRVTDGQGGMDVLLSSAEKAYRVYIKNADMADAEISKTHYAFAELLFARGQFREASEQYAVVGELAVNRKPASQAKADGKHPAKPDPKEVEAEAKITHDSAYGAIVALERAVGDSKWSDKDEKRFQELADRYFKVAPQGQFVLELKFKRAFIAYEKERYDEAGAQFKKIGWVDQYPNPEAQAKVLKAQDLYLDILNIKKDYAGLKEAAQALLGHSAEATRTTQIEKIYREAYFSEIQQMEEKGQTAAAVEAYKKFAHENTQSELAPKAWWNASLLQFKSGDTMGGAATCSEMPKLFPKAPMGRDCLKKAAQAYESTAQLGLAARTLLSLTTLEGDKTDAKEKDQLLEVASDFLALSGSRREAVEQYLKLAEGKRPEKQAQLLEKAMTVVESQSDDKSLQGLRSSLQAKFSQLGLEPHASRAIVEQAEGALASGDLTKAFNVSKKIIGRDGLPKELFARARFVQARVLEDEYRGQSVKARAERVGLVLAMKTEKLEKAQKAYQSVIGYGDSRSSVNAMRRLAELYLDYAKTVRGMSLGADVPAADQAVFAKEIEQLSIPMEEKGIEAMNQALETAKKAQLREGQIGELQREVDKLNMKPVATAPTSVRQPAVYVPSFNRFERDLAGTRVGQ
jgi:TolA-binding protein